MITLCSYITFNGNCRKAMQFYQKCLGGDLSIQQVGASPLAGKLPDKMKDYVLHARLVSRNFVLMGSDMVSESGLVRGNAVSLVLNCSTEKEIRVCYERLANGGEKNHPLEYTFWESLFGSLTDKFGNHWLLNFQSNHNQ